MLKTLFLSSLATWRYSASVLSCFRRTAERCSSGTCFLSRTVKPWSFSPTAGKFFRSVTVDAARRGNANPDSREPGVRNGALAAGCSRDSPFLRTPSDARNMTGELPRENRRKEVDGSTSQSCQGPRMSSLLYIGYRNSGASDRNGPQAEVARWRQRRNTPN